LRRAAYIGGLLGVALLATLLIRTDFAAMMQTLRSGGWTLLWLILYRGLFYVLYAACWMVLLRPYDSGLGIGLGYLFWATTVRDAIDRLLPVASVGGGVIGIRLLRWRGLATAPASASVIVEVALTVTVLCAFVGLGLNLLTGFNAGEAEYRRLLLGFLWVLPVPALLLLLLRYGAIFGRLQKILRRFLDAQWLSDNAASLDRELQAYFTRPGALTVAGVLQFAALISGSFEVWFALRLFGHPVSAAAAVVLESMTQAVRHLAFVVPAGVGVQEAGLVIFGHSLGIGSELALAVSAAKRIREVLCGLPSLISWQWMEGQRLRGTIPNAY
jgi:putative membrane protein